MLLTAYVEEWESYRKHQQGYCEETEDSQPQGGLCLLFTLCWSVVVGRVVEETEVGAEGGREDTHFDKGWHDEHAVLVEGEVALREHVI